MVTRCAIRARQRSQHDESHNPDMERLVKSACFVRSLHRFAPVVVQAGEQAPLNSGARAAGRVIMPRRLSEDAASVVAEVAIATVDHSDIRGSKPQNRDPSGAASDLERGSSPEARRIGFFEESPFRVPLDHRRCCVVSRAWPFAIWLRRRLLTSPLGLDLDTDRPDES